MVIFFYRWSEHCTRSVGGSLALKEIEIVKIKVQDVRHTYYGVWVEVGPVWQKNAH